MTEANQLLRSYAEGGSEGAFRELVNRYLDFVYSVALHRANGASQIAEEIAQTVFCDLAREAQNRNSRLLEADCALGGWLHRHACFVAANFLRAEQRRETRERIAAEMNSLETMGESAWQHLAPEIDEAINELGAEDRTALVLRFYEQRDLRAIGAALGVSEDAAQKRVCRGLEKLRGLLAGRGIGVSVGLLSVCLEEELLTAAPAGLAVTTSNVALAGVSATPGVVGPGGNPGGLAKAKGKLLAGAVGLGLLVLLSPILFRQNQARSSALSQPAFASNSTSAPAAVLAAADTNTPAGNQVPASQSTPFEGLRLKLVAADSGKPVPNVTIDYWCRDGSKSPRQKIQATRLGTCDIPFPRATTTSIQLTTQMDDFADTRLIWRPSRGEQIPTDYTLQLGRPVRISGKVVDEEGHPVAGAKVGWNHEQDPAPATGPESHCFGYIEVETDAEGRWSINRIAEEMLPRIYGGASHPEKAGSEFTFVRRKTELEKQLRDGTHVFRLGRAFTAQGLVLDPENRPVPGAKILVGTGSESNRREGKTGMDGTFSISGCKAGRNLLSAEAPEFAANTLTIDLKENSEPFHIQLQRGKTLSFRVVDKSGQPVPGASVSYHTPYPQPVNTATNRAEPIEARFHSLTDTNGLAVWTNAPDRELTFSVSKRQYMRLSEVWARPDNQLHVVTLSPALTISGTATDAKTGKPLPRFRLICGWPQTNSFRGGTDPHWSTLERFWASFSGGTFRHTLEEPLVHNVANAGYVFKIEADGYAPFISRNFAADEGEVELEAKLEPTASILVTVLLPDGRPAMNADVGYSSDGPGHLCLLPGALDRRSGLSTGTILSTDRNGQVALPANLGLGKIYAVHPQGYGEATPAVLQAEPTMALQPWGQLEVTCWSGGKPAANRELQLAYTEPDAKIFFGSEGRTKTDQQGHLTFLKVPPRRLKIVRIATVSQADNSRTTTPVPMSEVEVRPGETARVEIGKSDRNISLRWRWPEGWQVQSGWQIWGALCTPRPTPPSDIRTNRLALSAWQRQPENSRLIANALFFPLQQSEDGSWHAEDVPAGTYVLRVIVRDPQLPGLASVKFHFEAPVTIDEASAADRLDLGEVTLKLAEP